VPKEVTSVTFVGMLNKLVASCGDRNVRLYNADSQGPERSFTGPADFIYAAAVTSDGKIVVGGGQDSTLFEWNLENGQPIHNFPAPKPAEDPAAEKPAAEKTVAGAK
jgi:WD40 repeat protein